jgi:hypothetical protein
MSAPCKGWLVPLSILVVALCGLSFTYLLDVTGAQVYDDEPNFESPRSEEATDELPLTKSGFMHKLQVFPSNAPRTCVVVEQYPPAARYERDNELQSTFGVSVRMEVLRTKAMGTMTMAMTKTKKKTKKKMRRMEKKRRRRRRGRGNRRRLARRLGLDTSYAIKELISLFTRPMLS